MLNRNAKLNVTLGRQQLHEHVQQQGLMRITATNVQRSAPSMNTSEKEAAVCVAHQRSLYSSSLSYHSYSSGVHKSLYSMVWSVQSF